MSIDVSGVEMGDAEIEGLVDDFLAGRFIDAAAEIIASEPGQRQAQAGIAEIANFQDDIPL